MNTIEILIAEDSPTQAEVLKYILEKHDYTVTVAQDGKEALALIQKHTPSLVVSDIIMPEMNGYKLCKAIKSKENTREIPVILLTSLSRSEDVLDGLECGADNFITKPYAEDYLIAVIEQILANREIRKSERVSFGVEITFGGKKRYISATQQQMLTLLLSTYEAAAQRNSEFVQSQDELEKLNDHLEELVIERTAELSAEIDTRKNAEQVLETQHALLKALINSSNDTIIFSLDKNYCYTTFNDKHRVEMKLIWGADIKTGTNLLDCMYLPEMRELAKQSIDRTIKGETFSEIQYQENFDTYYEFSWNPVFQLKEVVGVAVFIRDITERRRSEEELLIANKELLFQNKEKGKRAEELIIANKELLFQNKEKEKRAAELIIANKELAFQNKEKEKRAEELIIANQELAFQNKEKEKRAAELIISESRYRSYVEATGQIAWVTNAEGEIEEDLPSFRKFTGQSYEEMKGSGWAKMLHPDDIEHTMQIWKNAVAIKTPYETEYRMSRYDGVYRHFLARGFPVFREDGTIIEWVGTCIDITERKLAEKELIVANKELAFQNKEKEMRAVELIKAKDRAEESDRLKSAFLANMSHEIRTPMNGILGFAELLRMPDLTGSQQQEYIGIIKKSGDRMLNIINNIVDISKIDSGQMKVFASETNINEQIEYIYTFFKPETDTKGIQLSFKNGLPANEAVLRTDREKIYAILTNLVKNAIKYCDKGSIEFGYILKGQYFEFYVKDTGIGIPDDRQVAIFDRFIQADIGDKRAFQGAGLGLSISTAYVLMLGGKIWVESEEKKGSTFYFTIPYLNHDKDVTADLYLHDGIAIKAKNLKILIVDDDETSEMLLTMAVKKFSKEVLKVSTGLAAVETCRNHPDIDLVMMDIKMPAMDGYEATRQIRRFNKDVVIIAQTAHTISDNCEKALAAGCNDYIPKPINLSLLNGLIQSHF